MRVEAKAGTRAERRMVREAFFWYSCCEAVESRAEYPRAALDCDDRRVRECREGPPESHQVGLRQKYTLYFGVNAELEPEMREKSLQWRALLAGIGKRWGEGFFAKHESLKDAEKSESRVWGGRPSRANVRSTARLRLLKEKIVGGGNIQPGESGWGTTAKKLRKPTPRSWKSAKSGISSYFHSGDGEESYGLRGAVGIYFFCKKPGTGRQLLSLAVDGVFGYCSFPHDGQYESDRVTRDDSGGDFFKVKWHSTPQSSFDVISTAKLLISKRKSSAVEFLSMVEIEKIFIHWPAGANIRPTAAQQQQFSNVNKRYSIFQLLRRVARSVSSRQPPSHQCLSLPSLPSSLPSKLAATSPRAPRQLPPTTVTRAELARCGLKNHGKSAGE
ncbi:hypothetical protein B0H19DRAFT_1073831 [Mycena capillaripes]|nr:hypothetical protein B0H19DRAFT_1073831 [Mycena capillaripes]